MPRADDRRLIGDSSASFDGDFCGETDELLGAAEKNTKIIIKNELRI